MPIFYAENPLEVTSSTPLPITGVVEVDNVVSASITGVVTVSQSNGWTVTSITNPVTVTSSAAAPVWITGAINAMTTNPSVEPTGATFPSSASMDGFVSGASNTVVFGRVGTGTMGSGVLVTLAEDQSTIGVSGTVSITQGGPLATLVSGTVTSSITGVVTVSQSNGWVVTSITNPVTVTSTFAAPVWVTQSQPVSVSTGTFPVVTVTATLASPVSVAVSGNISASISGVVTVTSSLAAPVWVTQSQPVQITGTATVQQGTNPWQVFQKIPGNGVITSASLSQSAIQILAANPSRLGLIIYNEGNPVAYVALSSTASTTVYTVQVPKNGTYEVSYQYTGSVWAVSNLAGPAVLRITELT